VANPTLVSFVLAGNRVKPDTGAMETDVLGAPYESMTLPMGHDDEGEVVATLVRRRAEAPSRRAVLYVHGWMDYFFQTNLADHYVERGYDFYALDLRKYGRSIRPHQTPYFCRSVTEYFPEIDEAVRIIREDDGHDLLILNGHSTGGLTGSLWAHRMRGQGLIDGLVLNSPFLDLNAPWMARNALADAVGLLGLRRPYATLPLNLPSHYGRSLHREHDGEWDFDLTWKPVGRVPVRAGWLRAVHVAHRRIRSGLDIDVPVLVLSSTASYRGRNWSDAVLRSDAVLDVNHIARWSPGLGRHVTLVRIDGGVHDIVLSAEPARKAAFAELDRWSNAFLPVGAAGE
jgi:alpha-beta hydrolase superfamily lysophospholipase